jgi:hypothetical protein
MAYAEIIEEAKTLSDNSASEVLDFIKFLKAKEEKKKTESLLIKSQEVI